MSMRHITVSTCGIIPGIEKFAEDFPQANLAISLHAASDDESSAIMPVNRKYGLKELIDACRQYTSATSRRITFEYTLIKGVRRSGRQQAAGFAPEGNPVPCEPDTA